MMTKGTDSQATDELHRRPTEARQRAMEGEDSETKVGDWVLGTIVFGAMALGLVAVLFYHSDSGFSVENYDTNRMWTFLLIVFLGPGLAFLNVLWSQRDLKSAALRDETGLNQFLSRQTDIALFFRSFSDLEARSYLMSAPGTKLHIGTKSLVVEAAETLSLEGLMPVMLGERQLMTRHEAAFPGLLMWTKDETWEQTAWALLRAAKVVVVFPEATDGVITELNRLRDNPAILEKSIVISPCGHFIPFDPPPFEPLDAWASIAEELKKAGFLLPAPEPSGYSYLPNPDFSAKKIVPFKRGTYGEMIDDGIAQLAASLSNVDPEKTTSAVEEISLLVDAGSVGVWSKSDVEAYFQ